jgi:hypothetical protein
MVLRAMHCDKSARGGKLQLARVGRGVLNAFTQHCTLHAHGESQLSIE